MNSKPDEHQLPYCLYRLPGGTNAYLCAGPVISLHETPEAEGFWFSNFNGKEAWCITPLIHREEADVKALSLPLYQKQVSGEETGQEAYQQLINTAIAAIREHTLNKVVFSRFKKLPLPAHFNVFSYFSTLCHAYPDAFVYLLSTPESGTWLGASPELLLRKRDTLIETMSLAGTRNGQYDKQPFGPKEWQEQELVTTYIKEKLSQWSDTLEVEGPVEKKAGNLTHLATYFTAKLHSAHHLAAMLKELHPTPAVCGLPKEEAMHFIETHETYPREMYAGYMGFVSAGNADIFVNLRCMQLYNYNTRLFAGGGIVEGSDPQAEWEETEAKMQTLERFLKED